MTLDPRQHEAEQAGVTAEWEAERRSEIEDRLDDLEQLAAAETKDYTAYCKIMAEIWELRGELAELGE